jgi:hypothetical protein
MMSFDMKRLQKSPSVSAAAASSEIFSSFVIVSSGGGLRLLGGSCVVHVTSSAGRPRFLSAVSLIVCLKSNSSLASKIHS